MVFHGTKITALDKRWMSPGFTNYDDLLKWDRNFISETLTTQVYWIEGDKKIWPGGMYLKKVLSTYWGRYFLRRAKSTKEARNYHYLQKIGIPVPQVLAIGERRKFGGLINAFLLTEGVTGAETLEAYATSHASQRGQEFFEIFGQLAAIVRKMHAANFYHIDLQWRNVLIQKTGAGVKVFVIDCPRGGRRRLPYLRWNGKMHDLAGLEKLGKAYLSSRERLRWFKMYNGGRRFNRNDRAMIRAVRKELGKKEGSEK